VPWGDGDGVWPQAVDVRRTSEQAYRMRRDMPCLHGEGVIYSAPIPR
jgi:hypothetical protein